MQYKEIIAVKKKTNDNALHLQNKDSCRQNLKVHACSFAGYSCNSYYLNYIATLSLGCVSGTIADYLVRYILGSAH